MSYRVTIENDEVVKIYEDGTKVTLAQRANSCDFKSDSMAVTSKEYPVQYTGGEVSAQEKEDIQNFLTTKKKEANESESGYAYYIAENKLWRISKYGNTEALNIALRGSDGKVTYTAYTAGQNDKKMLWECKEKGVPSYDKKECVYYWGTGLDKYRAMMELGDEVSNEKEISRRLDKQEKELLKGEVLESDTEFDDKVMPDVEKDTYMSISLITAGVIPNDMEWTIKVKDITKDVIIYNEDGTTSYVPLKEFKKDYFVVQNEELAQTCKQMMSTDYKERFKAEYAQLKNRLQGLEKMLEKWDNDELEFKPNCPKRIYDIQLKAMRDYKEVLEERADYEKIKLG